MPLLRRKLVRRRLIPRTRQQRALTRVINLSSIHTIIFNYMVNRYLAVLGY